jgi:hypothetical protein
LLLSRTKISTKVDAFIRASWNIVVVRPPPNVPQIPVPAWIIAWSKSRNLFLSMALNPWVLRPN